LEARLPKRGKRTESFGGLRGGTGRDPGKDWIGLTRWAGGANRGGKAEFALLEKGRKHYRELANEGCFKGSLTSLRVGGRASQRV